MSNDLIGILLLFGSPVLIVGIRYIEDFFDCRRIERTKLRREGVSDKKLHIAIQKGNFILSEFAWIEIIMPFKKDLRQIKQFFFANLEVSGFCGATKIKGSWLNGYTVRMYFENDCCAIKAITTWKDLIKLQGKKSEVESHESSVRYSFNVCPPISSTSRKTNSMLLRSRSMLRRREQSRLIKC